MGQSVTRPRRGILTAADLGGESQVWDDRKEPRLPCDREILICPATSTRGRRFRAVGLFDVSADGVGIVAPEPIRVGEQFLAKLRLDRLFLVAYTVRHCTPTADGRHFKIGAELAGFVGEQGAVPQAALDAILGRLRTPSRPAVPAARARPRSPS